MLRIVALVSLAALALAAIACGDDSDPPEPAPTATRTPTPVAPTATTRPPTATPGVTPMARTCLDPYPDGAPPQAGQPIRLRPTGSPPALASYQALPPSTDEELQRIVRYVVGPRNANRVSVVIKRLDDGSGVAVNANRVYYAASLFKTWIMLEAFHQRAAGLLDFGEEYIVTPHYKSYGLNPGELAVCEKTPVDNAMRSMMRISDNVAANLVLDRVGAGNVNQAVAGLGLRGTSIANQTLSTDAADMALLLEAIARRQAVDPAASDGMLELLESESINDRLPAMLPTGTLVAHKTGNWENATHDAGIVYHPKGAYVVVVLSDFGFNETGARLTAALSRAVYHYYNR